MKTKYTVLIILISLVVGIESIWIIGNRLPWAHTKKLAQYAAAVLAACQSEQFAPSCYDREIPKLMDNQGISMEDAFAVTRLVQKEDSQYLYCHVLAHKISFRETARDITKWKDVVARCPATMCNNGCQHGALMRRFNTEYLSDEQIEEVKPDLADVCEPRGTWNPTEVERSMCYHAIGHLAMFVTKAHIPKSLAICRDIGVKSDGRNYVQTCTEGVFMTVYQPLEPEDFALIASIMPKKETVSQFCQPYAGEAWDACHREAWAINRALIQSPDGLVMFCSYTDNPIGQKKCFAAVMNILTIELVIGSGGETENLANYCMALPASWQADCFSYAAMRLIQIDPLYEDTAVSVCEEAKRQQAGESCFRGLAGYGTFSFHMGSKELAAYCKRLPADWVEPCRNGTISN